MSQIAIIDNFLDDYAALEAHAHTLNYSGVINPVDSVLYPGISVDVPEQFKKEIERKIQQYFNVSDDLFWASIPLVFRLTLEGTNAPHQAHTDAIMGQYNFILYFNDGDENTGTSILRHKDTGIEIAPGDPELLQRLHEETNEYDNWEIVELCQAKKNRAAIIPSKLYHRAEPVGGFGTTPESGRLVLLCFFNIGYKE